jgi:hypothetical protein
LAAEKATLAVEMTRRGKRWKTQTASFPTLSSALGNPAKGAGFPHFHSDDGGCLTQKKDRKVMSKSYIPKLQDDRSKVTFLNCLTGASTKE